MLLKKQMGILQQIEMSASDLLVHYGHLNEDALLKCIKNNLENVRKRIIATASYGKILAHIHVNSINYRLKACGM